jgi:hypothetical protein
MRDRRVGGAGLLLGGAILASIALSAAASADEVVKSMSAVQACLCARESVAIGETQLGAARKSYEARKREADLLSSTVEEARTHLNTENRADIESFSALISRRDQAAMTFNAESARYAEAVQRYNEAVNNNNAMCLGRLFDPDQVEMVKANLACPR